ncbi:DNA polymerase III subunit delta [Ferrimonas sediminicola]|uniref:DNA polymerase III subunit delta n=1 Tax=Ferrimonas sediminicola TaxID=2569538 RepID=A0A4U1BEA6_9GAMM|nr:DNA polymerase III subunit delta [Ferrimonas sediminicola]TKB49483.1 DNA polymerase III subunit delta [Ferrimonas sediminicola]
MRIFVSQLGQHLARLPAIVMVFGDDPLLREEARDQIRTAAREQGFGERLSLVQESPFNWQELAQECHSLSLFANRRIIELELPNGKPGADGSAVLTELAPQLQDTLLLLHGPKLGKEQTNSKWFKTLETAGLYVQALTPEGPHYHRWLQGRLRHHGVNLQPDALMQFGEMFEGNLLAADQAMAQLALLAGNRSIGAEALARLLSNQSRYSVYQLTDLLLLGQCDKALTVLGQLKLEETAPVLINWALIRELQLLLELQQGLSRGENQAALFKRLKIWPKRQPLYRGCLQRLPLARITALLGRCGALEQSIKGESEAPWTELSEVCLGFAQRYPEFPSCL